MLVLKVPLDPFGTEHAVVHRKLLPRFETDNFVVLHFELNSALHTAEAAVGFHELIRLLVLPAARWLIVQVRPEFIDELDLVQG